MATTDTCVTMYMYMITHVTRGKGDARVITHYTSQNRRGRAMADTS